MSTATKILLLSPVVAAAACGNITGPSDQTGTLYHCHDPLFIPYPQPDGSSLIAVKCESWEVISACAYSTWTFPAPSHRSRWWPSPPEDDTVLRWPLGHVPQVLPIPARCHHEARP